MAELTPKQQRFCDEYLVDYNATQAAIRAGYTKSTASEQGSRLLGYAKVMAYLQVRVKKISQKLEISAERTLLEIARVAYTPASAFYDENGKLLQPHELGPDASACLSGFDVEEIKLEDVMIGTVKKIRRFDKNTSLGFLAKHFKLFVDAPAAPIHINLSSLSAAELKNMLAMLKKMNET